MKRSVLIALAAFALAGCTKWDYKNTSDIRYWPTQGETLSFYAYAPYTKNGVAIPVAYTKGDGMIMTDYTVPADDAGQVDLMYASALNVAKASPAVKVPLQFKHAMTQVRFKAKAKGDGVFIDVKENGGEYPSGLQGALPYQRKRGLRPPVRQ